MIRKDKGERQTFVSCEDTVPHEHHGEKFVKRPCATAPPVGRVGSSESSSALVLFQPLSGDDQYKIHVLARKERSHLEAEEGTPQISKISISFHSTQMSVQGRC